MHTENEFITGTIKANSEKQTLVWSLDGEGSLTVSGGKTIPDYSCGRNPDSPWQDLKDRIREVHIGEGIERIGINAFAGCRNLTKVCLPATLLHIRPRALQDCVSLKEIDTGGSSRTFCFIDDTEGICGPDGQRDPAAVTFGIGAFYNTAWAGARWGRYYSRNGVLFTCFTSETQITLPSDIHTIHRLAFSGTNVSEIIVEGTLEKAEAFAFYGCRIREMTIRRNIKIIHEDAFLNSSIEVIRFPEGTGQYSDIQMIEKESPRTGKITRRRTALHPFHLNGYVRLSFRPYGAGGRCRRLDVTTQTSRPDILERPCVFFRDKKQLIDRMVEAMEQGSWFFGIEHTRQNVLRLLSCSWNKKEDGVECFRAFPAMDEGHTVLRKESEVSNLFTDRTEFGRMILNNTALSDRNTNTAAASAPEQSSRSAMFSTDPEILFRAGCLRQENREKTGTADPQSITRQQDLPVVYVEWFLVDPAEDRDIKASKKTVLQPERKDGSAPVPDPRPQASVETRILRILELWLSHHSGKRILTVEENRQIQREILKRRTRETYPPEV